MLFSALLAALCLSVAPAGYIVDSIATSDPARMLVLRSDRSWALEPCDSAAAKGDSRIAVLLEGNFCAPLKAAVFTPFGEVGGMQHSGVDLLVEAGTPVVAAFDGIVTLSRADHSGYGQVVGIRHADGLETLYSNVRARCVEAGASVRAGEQIAEADSLDGAGPHLHFELRYGDIALDPARVIDFPSGTLRAPFCILDTERLVAASRVVSASPGEQREIFLAQQERIAEQKRLAAEEAARLARLEAAAKKYHTIRSGDTLSRIAAKYHTTVRTLCRLNGIKETTTLHIGRKIRVK